MNVRRHLSNYTELTKPRIALMVLVATAFGFGLSDEGVSDMPLLWLTLLGTGMAGAGASALNQYLERDVDALMERTRNRPLPTGAVSPQAALNFGVFLVLGGCLLLVGTVNLLSAFLALLSAFLYVLVYTPLKRHTWWNTAVGAVPGAMPPLIGWAAVTGTLPVGAWVLFAILYIWQHPHFYAIAWMYREDYERGGMKMLSVVKPGGGSLFGQVIAFSVLLIPVSIGPSLLGMSGWVYGAGAAVIGLAMLAAALVFAKSRSAKDARGVLRASVLYLPLLYLFLLIDAAL